MRGAGEGSVMVSVEELEDQLFDLMAGRCPPEPAPGRGDIQPQPGHIH